MTTYTFTGDDGDRLSSPWALLDSSQGVLPIIAGDAVGNQLYGGFAGAYLADAVSSDANSIEASLDLSLNGYSAMAADNDGFDVFLFLSYDDLSVYQLSIEHGSGILISVRFQRTSETPNQYQTIVSVYEYNGGTDTVSSQETVQSDQDLAHEGTLTATLSASGVTVTFAGTTLHTDSQARTMHGGDVGFATEIANVELPPAELTTVTDSESNEVSITYPFIVSLTLSHNESVPVATIPPAAAIPGVIGSSIDARIKSAIIGWLGGRVMEFSKESGQALPPSHFTVKDLLVESYDEGDATTAPYLKVKSATRADTGLGIASRTTYLGPCTEPRATLTHDKWVPRASDWTSGLLLIVYDQDDRTDTAGAAGQYAYITGRPHNDPRKLLLRAPLGIAPSADDVCCIGAQPFWLTWGIIAAGPMGSKVVPRNGQLIIRRINGEPWVRMEVYRRGETYQMADPAFPFKPSSISVDFSPTDLRKPFIFNFGNIDRAGDGASGTGFSMSVIALPQGEDWAFHELSYEAVWPDAYVEEQ